MERDSLNFCNLAESFDHTWRKRQRKIGTGFLIIFLMKLCFSRSQSGYQIILDEMCAALKESGLIPPDEKPVVSSSLCVARKKLDPTIIHQMNRELADSFLSLNHEYDREYYAYALAKKHIQLGIDAIFRMPSSGCA